MSLLIKIYMYNFVSSNLPSANREKLSDQICLFSFEASSKLVNLLSIHRAYDRAITGICGDLNSLLLNKKVRISMTTELRV